MICIIDYGMGNVHSILSALGHLGAETKISSLASEIERADKLILPGVGAFGKAMNTLRDRELDTLLNAQIALGKPTLGICLGMQCAVIEFARNVIGLKKAHTTEIDKNTKYPVIDIMEQQKKVINKGGTMRLGSFPCKIKNGSKTKKAYKQITTKERHRHRYEFNNTYLKDFEHAGMKATGVNPKSNLVEIIEIPKHPWFVGVQFHPEYKSTVSSPHPLFINFIEACLNQK